MYVFPPLSAPTPHQLTHARPPNSIHVPRLRPLRGHRRHHNLRPRVPSAGGAPAALEDRGRVPDEKPAQRVRNRECGPLCAAQGVPRQVPGPGAGGQHHEDPEGAGRDQNHTAQDD
ncbi:hypothetical protein FH972_022248 [Carpinus fangiana]|uniref:Uncharacterized protein n=1 Tax=Carpinus fangiana TaxID=176857 RepID=A0A5N6KRQ0_9ROSI|nr:hypothetical protein FH972_022248 [Carpinus fangiana]